MKCTGGETLTADTFIERSDIIHNKKYDYSKSIYVNSESDVEIICKTHGSFWQIASSHYCGARCPKCSTIHHSKVAMLWLNTLEKIYGIKIQHFENDGEFVIPTTKYKADGYYKKTNTIYEFNDLLWHENPGVLDHNKTAYVGKTY